MQRRAFLKQVLYLGYALGAQGGMSEREARALAVGSTAAGSAMEEMHSAARALARGGGDRGRITYNTSYASRGNEQ